MLKADQTLSRIVALKRQKAEQSLALMQASLRQSREKLVELETELARANDIGLDFEMLKLANQNGHIQRMLHDMERVRGEIAIIEGRLEDAREALKQILMSEDELSRINVARRSA